MENFIMEVNLLPFIYLVNISPNLKISVPIFMCMYFFKLYPFSETVFLKIFIILFSRLKVKEF